MRILLIALRLWWIVKTARPLDIWAPGVPSYLNENIVGLNNDIADGSTGNPVTASGPTVRITRTEYYADPVHAQNNEANAALMVTSQGQHLTTMQVVGIYGQAISSGMTAAEKTAYDAAHPSAPANNDCVGVMGIGMGRAGNRGGGTGGYFAGYSQEATGTCAGAEVRAGNLRNVAGTVGASGPSDVVGIWASISSTPTQHGGAAYEAGSGDGTTKWSVVLHGAAAGATAALVRDDTGATASYLDNGTHTYSLDLNGATNSAAAMRIAKADRIVARNNAGSADVALIQKENAAADRVSIGGGALYVDPATANAALGGSLTVTGTASSIGVEAKTAPTLLSSWVNHGSLGPACKYWKDALGIVHIEGVVTGGTATAGTAIFVLGAAYRPTGNERPFVVVSNDAFAEVRIDSSGNVKIQSGSASWLSFNGITFDTR